MIPKLSPPVCCLSQKGQFIELVQCKHLWLFGTIKNFQINNNFRRVCVMCHHLLVKFSQLRQQIVENMILLEKQIYKSNNSKRKFNFKRTRVEHLGIPSVTKKSDKGHEQSAIVEDFRETDSESDYGGEDLLNSVPKLPTVEQPLLTMLKAIKTRKEHDQIIKQKANEQILMSKVHKSSKLDKFGCGITNSVTVDPLPALDSLSIFESDFEIKFQELNDLLENESQTEMNFKMEDKHSDNVPQTMTHVEVKEEYSLNDTEISLKTEPDDVCDDIETSIAVNVIPTKMETEAGSAQAHVENKWVSSTAGTSLGQTTTKEFQIPKYNTNSFDANKKAQESNMSMMKIVRVKSLAKPVLSGTNKSLNMVHRNQNVIKSALDPRKLGIHSKRYVCQHCNFRCKNLTEAINHQSEVHYHNQDSWEDKKCDHEGCDYVAKSRRILYSHAEKEHKEWTHKCDQCYKVYPNSYRLKMHKLTHEEKRYECKTCHKFLSTLKSLKNHEILMHTPRPPTTAATAATPAHCAKCNKTYKTDKLLQMHLKKSVHHDESIRHSCTCDHCGRGYVEKESLRAHILGKHFPAWRPKCPICSKVFSRETTVRKHVKLVHEKKKPPKNKMCSHCGKGFGRTAELRIHLRTHTGERPLLCAHCGATFAHPGALRTHIRLKHKGRPNTNTNTEAKK